MASGDTSYTTRFETQEFLVKNSAQIIQCPLYLAGSLVAPTSGTVSIYNGSNVAVVDAASVTISSSIATYSIVSNTFSSQTLGDGWKVVWTLTVSGVVIPPIERWASLCRKRLVCPISAQDLYDMNATLNPSNGQNTVPSGTNWDGKIKMAWTTITNDLVNEGKRPYLISDESALRNVVLYLTLSLIFEELHTIKPNLGFEAYAERYFDQYTKAWSTKQLMYDVANDGDHTNDVPKAILAGYWL